MEEQIPKIIHYCWFGKGEKKDLIKKCIQSWEKYLPDYRIVEWNEGNFDINSIPYTKEAYENKKWAFVSDYIRLYALYNYGGIYFDTDVEVTKSLDVFLRYNVFLGFQSDNSILTAVIGAKQKHNFIKILLDEYYDKHFVENGQMIMQTNNDFLTKVCVKDFNLKQDNSNQILNNDVYVFSKEYFSVNITKEKNFSIHYGDASWFPYDRAIKELKTYRSYYFYLLKLIENMINCKKLQKKLINKTVAVYGNGQIGHILIKLLNAQGIKPVCIIDKNIECNQYNDIPVVSIVESKNFSFDCVVITPITYLNDISKNLNDNFNNIEIISVEDIYEE
ncbi:glycosyltransferase [Clostridium sp. YIM B02555]|uniref:glycosyltransferase family 32 protein n=1 Tax=Clostridium sp. YIM B02555 TaxID=2911968 RepID=UPI001EEE6B66|nr:glycosyltransferase [Clostridium sp. YIM B02555]